MLPVLPLLDLHRLKQFGIGQDAAAVLTNDDLLVLPDLRLALGRYLVEASAAGITFDADHSQAVAVGLADLFVGGQQTGIHILPGLGGQFLVLLLFFFGVCNDLFQLGLLVL